MNSGSDKPCSFYALISSPVSHRGHLRIIAEYQMLSICYHMLSITSASPVFMRVSAKTVYSSSSLHKEICVILVACALLLFGFIAHLDHDNLYRAQSVLKMYSRLFLVQTVSRLVSPICTHWLLCLNQSPY